MLLLTGGVVNCTGAVAVADCKRTISKVNITLKTDSMKGFVIVKQSNPPNPIQEVRNLSSNLST